MNWAQFEDPVSNMCLAGAMLECWSLTEMASSSPFTVKTNIFVTQFADFSEIFRKNSIVWDHTCFFLSNSAISVKGKRLN